MVSPARAQVQSLALVSSFEVPGEGWRRVVVQPGRELDTAGLGLSHSFGVTDRPGVSGGRDLAGLIADVGADALLVDLFRVGENPSFQARPVFRPIENISVPGVGDINPRCTG